MKGDVRIKLKEAPNVKIKMFRKMTENADVDNSITLLQEQLDLMVRRTSVTNVEEFPGAVNSSVVTGPEGHYK